MQRTIDVTTARRQFGTLLDEVYYRGDTITIERKGKPLARLVPPSIGDAHEAPVTLGLGRRRLIEGLSSLPVLSMNGDPTEALRRIRSQRRRVAEEDYE